MASAGSFLSLAFSSSSDFRRLTSGTAILLTPGIIGGVGKTLLHGDVLMWLMKT
jgi:hypothetical protein